MHRTIGYLSKRVAHIRPGEGPRVLLTFLYFFLIITAYYVIKPVSRSLVLGDLGARLVPYADLICAILMGPIVTLFARLVDRVPKPKLVSGSFWTVIGMLVIFWQLLHWPVAWISGAFYIWVAIFSVLVVTLFWLVANDLYRPREAKRLFGFIGSGGILGGIVGSSIAAVGAQVLGTEHLILLSAGLLILCWLVVRRLWQLVPERSHEHAAWPAGRRDTFLSDSRGFIKLVTGSRYLLLLVALVGINKIVATLVYYQLNPFIEQTFPGQDAKTTFTGMFFGSLNVVSFIVQFFFTSWILRRWGLSVALLVLPVGVLVGATGLLFFPVFWLAASTELYDGAMNYSLQQTTKEVLYLPIDRSVRYKVKPFIDMVVFRFGKGIAAIIGIVLLDVLRVPPRVLSYVAVPLLIGWLVVAWWLRHDYVATIRTMLQARAAARRHPVGAAQPARTAQPHRMTPASALLAEETSARKLAAAKQLLARSNVEELPARELLEALQASTDISPSGDGVRVEDDARRLMAIIIDPSESLSTRRQAIQRLVRASDQETVDHLLGIVLSESDSGLREEAIKGLVALRVRGGRLDFPLQQIHRQIAREVDHYQRIAQVAAVYRQHHREPLAPDDPVLALLRLLAEETVVQVFRLLTLIYRPQDIQLVYEQLRTADTHLQVDAIELLDNLVDPRMRATIFPILDEERFPPPLLEDPAEGSPDPAVAYRVLQEAIWDHDQWLSVVTLCAIGRLRLAAMRPELDKALHHTVPLVATAAKVALHAARLT